MEINKHIDINSRNMETELAGTTINDVIKVLDAYKGVVQEDDDNTHSGLYTRLRPLIT